MPTEPGDSDDRIEYILNFVGTAGYMRFNQWKSAAVTPDDHTTTKKSIERFLNYLASNMEHDV